ncbi:MAG: electron transfer flavoprotein subunit beta/FixA family protein [Actinomycetota bacterium]|nr:electron transfer flavoprotein subunit beta/FixA family protein [Actinomycetota bacterium]
MKIVVLVKQVPDTEEERRLDVATGILDRKAAENVPDEISERALEVALQYKDAHKDADVVVLSMGPDTVTKTLRKMLSMGADSAVHVVDDALAGSDVNRTSVVLAAALKHIGFDLVVAGNESTDGRGGVVPAMVAEHLRLPLLPSLNSIDVQEAAVSGDCSVDGGSLSLRAPLPAVVSVTERVAEARFPNFKGIMKAKKKPSSVMSLAELGLDAASLNAGGRSVVVSATERPARTAGRKVVDDGRAAVELAEFLVAGRLI